MTLRGCPSLGTTETIKYFPKLEAGLTKAQAAKPPMPDFDFGMPSTSTAPEPDFS